jgi:tetratricopeptide (TPR) repeat protein
MRPAAGRGDLAVFQQAVKAHREGRREEARRGYRKLLAADPRHLDALRLCASLDLQAGDAATALALYDQAVKIAPGRADVWNDRGVALQRLGRLDDALADLQECVRLDPGSAEALYNRGNVLALLERREEALVSYAEAVRLKPDHAEAFHNRGAVLQMLGRYADAVEAYTETLRLKPDHAEAFFNRGNSLALQGRNDEALPDYAEAICLKPGHAGAFNNRGLALQDLGRFDEALAGYSEAIRLRPGFPGASVNRARLRLFRRDLRAGFAEFHHRWHEPSPTSLPQPTTLPACRPDTLRGRLLLWAEQGIGDEVFFAGLLPELLKRDVSVTLTADRRLHAIFARSFPQVRLLDRAVAMRASIDGGYDAQAPMGDLAHLLDVDAASVEASRTAFLKADARRRDEMRAKLAALGGGRVCGIAWHSANKRFSAAKSIDLAQLRPLLETPDTVFVNLQYGAVDAELAALHARTGLRIHRIEGLDVREDIDGLAALIDACDAVVTVSNVTAHLAGALGKRGAVLVPYSKGRLWYWHEGDERSLWYPGLSVFWQDDPSGWSRPVDACTRWLRGLR